MNFYDPGVQAQAMDIIATEFESKLCNECRRPIQHIYVEEVADSYIKISAHCGGGGHNLHVFTLTASDFE